MQFKHPEFLYALFALLIPVLVHLFQLRRFKKVEFTNVQFLKSVTLQTRKSSKIKKWLVLLSRLLALAAIIIAFAQPYFAKTDFVNKKTETVIYLDNSFSMQARGDKGPLLQRVVQDLLQNIPEDEVFTLFTNDETFNQVSTKSIQNDLLQLEYSPFQLDYETVYLKGKGLFSETRNTLKQLIVISDFQQKQSELKFPLDSLITTKVVQVQPVAIKNIAVDSLYIERKNNNNIELKVEVSNTENLNGQTVPVALYEEDRLLAKTSVELNSDQKKTATITLNNPEQINGRVIIQDPNLNFDNTRFFTINPPKKIKVIAISDASDDFLKKIYTKDEFELINYNVKDFDFNQLTDANFVVVNELKEMPLPLSNTLKNFVDQGGTICIIPSDVENPQSYNQFFQNLGISPFQNLRSQERKITKINFSHPLYDGVFNKQISNFQYPKVNSFYPVNTSSAILFFDNNNPFVFSQNNIYVFTASLNKENSNFKNSPLIVPTLYNMAKQSLKISDISYTIGKKSKYDIAVKLGSDEILNLVSENEQFIPLQQSYPTKVSISTEDIPTHSGIYAIQNKEEIIQYVSYNYTTEESDLSYYSLKNLNQAEVFDSVSSMFGALKEDLSIQELWKWFVIFALFFLFVEIFLLKYLK